MKKYIKSTRGTLVYEIERQSFTEKFRTPEDYFTHATRSVWYSTTGFNMFVQYKGAFYMIDRTDAHGYITSLEFSPVTAEEAAAAKMERAAQAMNEAQEHEAKTAAAALDYDTETAEAEAREARFAADYAEILARESAELAAEAGTSNAASIADATAEYSERARHYATIAEETAEQNAAEAAARADRRDLFSEQAEFEQYAAELAAVEAAAPEALASESNTEDAVNLIAYTAFEALNSGANPDTYADEDMEQLDRLIGYAAEIVRRNGPAHGIQWAPYQRCELEAFLGEPDDYDVDAIEAETTEYDPATGRTVWTAFGDDLAAIAERHELYTYAPAI